VMRRSRRRSLKPRGRRSALQPAVSTPLQEKRQTVQVHLRAPHDELCSLLFVGEVFEMVKRAIATGLQSDALARGMEEDALQQPEAEDSAGGGDQSVNSGRAT